MAARMAVVVVPILEPKDNGYALSMLMTPIPIYTKDSPVKHDTESLGKAESGQIFTVMATENRNQLKTQR